MKTEVKINRDTIDEFPFLARNVEKGYVVLFTELDTGTVVAIDCNCSPAHGCECRKLGFHSANWSNVYSECWEKLPKDSSVTLIQE